MIFLHRDITKKHKLVGSLFSCRALSQVLSLLKRLIMVEAYGTFGFVLFECSKKIEKK